MHMVHSVLLVTIACKCELVLFSILRCGSRIIFTILQSKHKFEN